MSAGASAALADRATDVLVLGLGNVLLSDDGLGPAALERLERRYACPAGVRMEDGGTLGLALLDLVADARRVILVDAVASDEAPGTLVRLHGDEVLGAVRDRLSPHQVGVADLLAAARLIGRYPGAVTLLGLVPASFELDVACTPGVQANIDALVAAVVEQLEAFGYPLLPASAAAHPLPSGATP